MMIISNKVYYSYHVNAIQLTNPEKISINTIKIKLKLYIKNNYSIKCNDASSNKNP